MAETLEQPVPENAEGKSKIERMKDIATLIIAEVQKRVKNDLKTRVIIIPSIR